MIKKLIRFCRSISFGGAALALVLILVLIAGTLSVQHRMDRAASPSASKPPSQRQTAGTNALTVNAPVGQGRWLSKAPLPIFRSEMTSATEVDGKIYVIGGYAKNRFDQPINQVYDPAPDTWRNLAPMPRGVNHLATVGLNGKIYAVGGFIEQNKNAVTNVWEYDIATDKWRALAPLPSPRGSVGLVALNGKIHAVGGRDKVSLGTHEVYDPATNTWSELAPLPGARDHIGLVVFNGNIHAFGGRFNTFEYNTDLHHVYDPATDSWKTRAPMPTARSGHAGVVYRGRILAIGGEGYGHVFNENEAYDPISDSWTSLVPMPTPRHGTGAAVVDDVVYIPGGGPVNGGSLQSAIHEAFTLK